MFIYYSVTILLICYSVYNMLICYYVFNSYYVFKKLLCLYGSFGYFLKSGFRFSRNAFPPSCASSRK